MNQNLEIVKKLGLHVGRVSDVGETILTCPLHDDENPSLSINLISGKFQCFAGCIKGNSIRDLVFKLSGETLQEGTENNWLHLFKRKLLYKKVDDIHRIPSIPLLPLAYDNDGEVYLRNRGFNRVSIIRWGIRFWEEQNAVVIPIHNIGYILRYLSGEKKYKYVTGTTVSETLFGINKCQLDNTNSVILVEGALDCVWLHQNGFKNTVAILGSNLSETQYKLLTGLCKQVFIMMDGDEGGSKAAKQISKVLRQNFIVKICQLLQSRDPQLCNKEELKNSIKDAKII